MIASIILFTSALGATKALDIRCTTNSDCTATQDCVYMRQGKEDFLVGLYENVDQWTGMGFEEEKYFLYTVCMEKSHHTVALGDDCPFAAQDKRCEFDTYCDWTVPTGLQGTCTAFPTAGECTSGGLCKESDGVCGAVDTDGVFVDKLTDAANGRCLPVVGKGDSCTAKACVGGKNLYCNSSDVCADFPGSGEACYGGKHCNAGLTCSPTGVCETATVYGEHCKADGHCTNGSCMKKDPSNGLYSAVSDETGYCMQEADPEKLCNNSWYCSTDYHCYHSKCYPRGALNGPCKADNTCTDWQGVANVCENGFCVVPPKVEGELYKLAVGSAFMMAALF